MLEPSRDFSIPCPRRLQHPGPPLHLASAKLVHQTIMCHRSESFSNSAIFMYFALETLCSLSRGFMRFHFSTIRRFGSHVISNLWHRSDFRAAGNSSCTAWLEPQVDLAVSMYFQWNRQCFFLRYAELNSRFIVMTIDKVTLHRPKVGTCFSVICWF